MQRVEHKPIPKNPVNDYFVYFHGISHGYNLTMLLEPGVQVKLATEYDNRLAHACPDIPGHKCPDPRKGNNIESLRNAAVLLDAAACTLSQAVSCLEGGLREQVADLRKQVVTQHVVLLAKVQKKGASKR